MASRTRWTTPLLILLLLLAVAYIKRKISMPINSDKDLSLADAADDEYNYWSN